MKEYHFSKPLILSFTVIIINKTTLKDNIFPSNSIDRKPIYQMVAMVPQ